MYMKDPNCVDELSSGSLVQDPYGGGGAAAAVAAAAIFPASPTYIGKGATHTDTATPYRYHKQNFPILLM